MNILKEVKRVKDKELNEAIKMNVAVRYVGYLSLIVLWVLTIICIIKGCWISLAIAVPLTVATVYVSIGGYKSDKEAIELAVKHSNIHYSKII